MMDDNKLYIEDFPDISFNGSGQIKIKCPICINTRSNKRDRSLSINKQTLAYHCHYCDAKGVLRSRNEKLNNTAIQFFKPQKKEYKRPNRVVKVEDGMYSQPFIDYFKSRGISEKTMKVVGITEEKERFGGDKQRRGCIGFNFLLNGEVINTKYRTRDKQFKLISGAELIPYNLDSIHPSTFKDGEEKYALFTEGEVDCMTWVECGYEHAVSAPNGANANMEYLDDYIDEYFEPLDVVYISVDNDRKGMEFRYELLRRFGSARCRIIDYPEPCKDINEVLVTYGKNAVIECFKSYTEIKPDGVMELRDIETDLDYLFQNGFQPGVKIGMPNVDRLLSFRIGMLVIVTGVPTSGKTYLLNFILSKLNIIHNWKIAFFSPEFYPVSDHVGQMMETLGGLKFHSSNYDSRTYETMKEYVNNNLFWIDPDDTDINSVMERAIYLIKKKGIKALVIDPFNSLTDKNYKGGRKDEYISDFLQMLRAFARKYGIAVFLVMHPTKMSKLDTGLYPVCDLYNCKGASEVYDKADIGLSMWRNEYEDYCELYIVKMKFRSMGSKGHVSMKFNLNNGRYVELGFDAAEEMKRGANIKGLPVTWDNSNYIVDKINQVRKESLNTSAFDQYDYYSSFNGYQKEPISDMPFAPAADNEEVPF